jgi:hypothetical protein
MIGGTVIATRDDGKTVWVNTREKYPSKCESAVHIERTPKSLSISEGDKLFWENDEVFWTPKNRYDRSYAQIDIKLKKIEGVEMVKDIVQAKQ